MFVGTLADNLRLGDDTATEDELVAALEAVDADGWALALPGGLATRVGSGGLALSPAQAQQVALARLVLADPHTLVLDEATSLLDRGAARSLERSLGKVRRGPYRRRRGAPPAHRARRRPGRRRGRGPGHRAGQRTPSCSRPTATTRRCGTRGRPTGRRCRERSRGRRPAAGAGSSVAPERLERWLDGFAERHGAVPCRDGPVLAAPRTAPTAEVEVPFPPLAGDLVGARPRRPAGGDAARAARRPARSASPRAPAWSSQGGQPAGARPVGRGRLVPAALRPAARGPGAGGARRGHRRRPSRAAAARRRAGRRRCRRRADSVDAVLADRRLAPLVPLVTGRFLDVPDPRQKVLETVPGMLREVQIKVTDP